MAKAKRKNRSRPYAELNLARPSAKAVEASFQDFVELAESLADQQRLLAAQSAYIDDLSPEEVLTILQENIDPLLIQELIEGGDYGRGLLMGTILLVRHEQLEAEAAE